MSDASSSPGTPSDSASPEDPVLAQLDDTRITESDNEAEEGGKEEDNEEAGQPVEANRRDTTAACTGSLQPGIFSSHRDSAAEIQAEPECQPDTDGPSQEELESSAQVESESRGYAGTRSQPLDGQHEKENGSVTQPYLVDDETTAKSTDGDIPVPDTVIDGRVKQNPVPVKYIAKATKRDGNFGVMQMGHGRAFMDARDLAAKRSSEATQAAAEKAVRTGNNGMARRKHVWKPADANMATPPPPQQQQRYQQAANQYPPNPGHYALPGGLSLADLKGEQARLLTFLRGIHPVIVVDQLCKALAYFGGIPGAPAPPGASAFPQSAKANGSGMLLVGWLSEIFPPADYTKPPFSNFPHNLPNMGYGYSMPLDQNAPPKSTTVPAPKAASIPVPVPVSEPEPPQPQTRAPEPVDPNAPPKRKRGRPKGSKNSKFRKDKGVKRVTLTPGDVPPHPDGTPWKPGDPHSMVDLTQDTDSSLPAPTPEKTLKLPVISQSQATMDSRGADLSAPGPSPVAPSKRGRPYGTKTHARAVPTPNLPKLPDTLSTGSISAESPNADVSRMTGNASSTAHHSPQKVASTQKEASLSDHAQTWIHPEPNVLTESRPVSSSEMAAQGNSSSLEAEANPPLAAQAAPPQVPAIASSAQHSQANDSKKRKLQHSPLALPTPVTAAVPRPAQHQIGRTESDEVDAQAKRRRTTSGTNQASFHHSPRPQTQAPAVSANDTANNTFPAPKSAGRRPSDASHKGVAARPDSMQAAPQYYQRPSIPNGQYRSQQSPPFSQAQNDIQPPQLGPYFQKSQHYDQRPQPQQQPCAQVGYQQQNNDASFGRTPGMNNARQFSYDNDDYTNSNSYAVSARRAVEDASSFDNQSMYGQLGRR